MGGIGRFARVVDDGASVPDGLVIVLYRARPDFERRDWNWRSVISFGAALASSVDKRRALKRGVLDSEQDIANRVNASEDGLVRQ
jgi:hypothetical protein